jgi:endonuclease/exonuclease/phosphatase family metal-dependent hydrolase
VILTGDFNSGWAQGSTVRHLCTALGLRAYRPHGYGLETFPAFGERLDWILVSAGIEFRRYALLPGGLSDHRGVIADLALRPDGALRLARRD